MSNRLGAHAIVVGGRVRYFEAVDALTADDPDVHRLVFEVMNLCKPLTVLLEEPLRSRALERLGRRAAVA